MKAMEVTAGLVESNGSLPLVDSLKSPVGFVSSSSFIAV